MTNSNTRRALFSSLIALVVCFTMLIGTTFAWFTDSVSSDTNIIKAGSLDVAMYWANADEDPASVTWKDASVGPIFNYDKWEPGYVEAKHIKIKNEGSLAFKYKLMIEPIFDENVQTLSILADVIDVYFIEGARQIGRTDLEALTPVGTLRDMIEDKDGAIYGAILPEGETAAGNYERVGEATATIAFKMRESADNNYEFLSIGANFSIQLVATQYTHEADFENNLYDADATYKTSVQTLNAFFTAIENGDDVLLAEPLVINDNFIDYMNERYPVATLSLRGRTQIFTDNAVIDGDGITVYRTEDMAGKPLISVASGYTVTLSNITLDGGAKWTGAIDPVLLRGTTNSGIATTANIISTSGNANIVLGEGAVVQNNDGSNAISLATRGGGTLTLDGGEILNNNGGGAGAIWGGGHIVINDGKINGNYGGIGGVVRTVDGQSGRVVSFTMNGGEIKNNSANNGGVIWSGNNLDVFFNGGEIADNYAASGGGVVWGGSADKYVVSGNVEIHDNVAGELGNVFRMNHYRWPSLTITGGRIYDNDAESGQAAIYALNNPVSLLGGYIDDDILFTGNDYLTVGAVELLGTVHCSIGLNVNQVKLTVDFSGFKFTADEAAANFAAFNLKPAEGYVYTEGDEAKLVCMNENYVTYWDAATESFRLQAKN